jgi:hypothetical protein
MIHKIMPSSLKIYRPYLHHPDTPLGFEWLTLNAMKGCGLFALHSVADAPLMEWLYD